METIIVIVLHNYCVQYFTICFVYLYDLFNTFDIIFVYYHVMFDINLIITFSECQLIFKNYNFQYDRVWSPFNQSKFNANGQIFIEQKMIDFYIILF